MFFNVKIISTGILFASVWLAFASTSGLRSRSQTVCTAPLERGTGWIAIATNLRSMIAMELFTRYKWSGQMIRLDRDPARSRSVSAVDTGIRSIGYFITVCVIGVVRLVKILTYFFYSLLSYSALLFYYWPNRNSLHNKTEWPWVTFSKQHCSGFTSLSY